MTEHEIALQKARREGWAAGWLLGLFGGRQYDDIAKANADEAAARAYPITVTRPRVVRVPWKLNDVQYRIEGGALEYFDFCADRWKRSDVTVEAVRLLVDLLNNPTEEVAE